MSKIDVTMYSQKDFELEVKNLISKYFNRVEVNFNDDSDYYYANFYDLNYTFKYNLYNYSYSIIFTDIYKKYQLTNNLSLHTLEETYLSFIEGYFNVGNN